jgi:hypothetical protein
MHKMFSSKDDRESLETAIDSKNKVSFDALTEENPALVFFVSTSFLKKTDKQTWTACLNLLKNEGEVQLPLQYLTIKRRYLVGLSKLEGDLNGKQRQDIGNALDVLKGELQDLTKQLKEKGDLKSDAEWDQVEVPDLEENKRSCLVM